MLEDLRRELEMNRKQKIYTVDRKGRFKTVSKLIPNTFIQIQDCENHLKVKIQKGFNIKALLHKMKYILSDGFKEE